MNGTVTMQSHTDTFTSRELAELSLEAVKLANAKNDLHGIRIAYSDITECDIMQYASDVKLLPVWEWENEMKDADRKLRLAAGYWKYRHVEWDDGESDKDDCRFYVYLDDVQLFAVSQKEWEQYLDEMREAGQITDDMHYVFLEEAREAVRYKKNPVKERDRWEKDIKKIDKRLEELKPEILKMTGHDKLDCDCIMPDDFDKRIPNEENVLVLDDGWRIMDSYDAHFYLNPYGDSDYDAWYLDNDTFYAIYRLLRENGLRKEPKKAG